ncbi:acyl-CoA dehydrogenase family protein [Enhygromyxa salina]|uniref:Acyl-CoA dehydrogenase n=1 Tax=Enhygromyxa salina TaxID=215803 RepID=A0A2S9YQB8_9BACT|nr:acyl-CoA dehydrogenase family protein [Enhygromyxa salina]PRQ07262.1 Acyl-CoA dehydrogenase [Enhygromyxa salina]
MDFTPSETQDMIRSTARQFAARSLEPSAAALDRDHRFPRETLAEAAELGLLGINVPAEYGGVEAGAVAYSLAVTELARACAATTVAICVSNMVAEVICAFGNEAQRDEHVTKLCSGEYVVGGFALSESGAGSDPGGMTTRARKTDKGWVIDGSKLWITSGTDAGLFVVWARTSDAPGARGVSCFLVRGDAPGLTAGKPEEKLGQRGSPTTALEFEGVEVGDDALLGELERGFPVAMMALDGGRVGIASLALGVGLAASEFANRYALERQQFGQSITNFQAIQWMIADSATELEAARLLTLRAAWLKQSGKPFTREASMAKLWASERAFTACNRALQMLGGYGYTQDFPVERYLRDVRVTMIYEGTSEIQRVVIGRDVVRQFSS